jgi:hypothetical protein
VQVIKEVLLVMNKEKSIPENHQAKDLEKQDQMKLIDHLKDL